MCKPNRDNYTNGELGPAIRDTIAKATHEYYRNAKEDSNFSEVQEMASWDKLREDFKESNLQQATDILKKLQYIGCKVRKARNIPVSLMIFTNSEIEIMAEMEHERWMAQRIAQGWKPGASRDSDKKTSPYLIPWSDLPDDIKELDRRPVLKIPEFLANAGFEIYKSK